MAKGSGGTIQGGSNSNTTGAVRVSKGIAYKGSIQKALDNSIRISDIKDAGVRRALEKAISKYENVFGTKTQNIRVAPLIGAYGVTYFNNDGSTGGILLDRTFFDRSKAKVVSDYKQNYKGGKSRQKNRSSSPMEHTMIHELGHASWSTYSEKANAKAAAPEIKNLYKTYLTDKKRKGYGLYSTSNVDEFYAELTVSAVHGRKDKYTRAYMNIHKKYNL